MVEWKKIEDLDYDGLIIVYPINVEAGLPVIELLGEDFKDSILAARWKTVRLWTKIPVFPNGWRSLVNDPVTEDFNNNVLLYHPELKDRYHYKTNYIVSNPAYARINAYKNGYTHWIDLEKPCIDYEELLQSDSDLTEVLMSSAFMYINTVDLDKEVNGARAVYQNCTIAFRDDREDIVFNTGDPVADYRSMVLKICDLYESREITHSFATSSVNDFVFDVPGFRFTENDVLVRDDR